MSQTKPASKRKRATKTLSVSVLGVAGHVIGSNDRGFGSGNAVAGYGTASRHLDG